MLLKSTDVRCCFVAIGGSGAKGAHVAVYHLANIAVVKVAVERQVLAWLCSGCCPYHALAVVCGMLPASAVIFYQVGTCYYHCQLIGVRLQSVLLAKVYMQHACGGRLSRAKEVVARPIAIELHYK